MAAACVPTAARAAPLRSASRAPRRARAGDRVCASAARSVRVCAKGRGKGKGNGGGERTQPDVQWDGEEYGDEYGEEYGEEYGDADTILPEMMSEAEELAALAGEAYEVDAADAGPSAALEAEPADADEVEEYADVADAYAVDNDEYEDEEGEAVDYAAAAVAAEMAEDAAAMSEQQPSPGTPVSDAEARDAARERAAARRVRSREKRVWNAKRNARIRQIEKQRAEARDTGVRESRAEEAPRALSGIAGVISDAVEGVARSVGEDAVESFNANVNPVSAGKRAREVIGGAWASLTGSARLAQELQYERSRWTRMPEATLDDFRAPQAAYTKVLVVGATGRVGRVLVRKLLLRGYEVRCMVRELPRGIETLPGLPASVELVKGDLRDPVSVGRAVRGCSKVICCARAATPVRADLEAVDAYGPQYLCSALLNEYVLESQRRRGTNRRSKYTLHNFERRGRDDMSAWKVRTEAAETFNALNEDFLEKYRSQLAGSSQAECGPLGDEWGRSHMLRFNGRIAPTGGAAEMSAPLVGPTFDVEGSKSHRLGEQLASLEGLQMRVSSDRSKMYSLVLEDTEGARYAARFYTKRGFATVRMPMSAFRPMDDADGNDVPPLGSRPLARIALRYEATARPGTRGGVAREAALSASSDEQLYFGLSLHFIKAMPAVEEPDIVLVSCAGAGVDEESREAVVAAKQMGEEFVKSSGLCYTVVRPGKLIEEPGSNKALIFDQGDRVDQPISCADVADVCLRAMHDPAAANKAFDVSYEREESDSAYELVAHVPSTSSSYLSTALGPLKKNY